MRRIWVFIFGTLALAAVGLFASCAEQPLEPPKPTPFEVLTSQSDTTITLMNIPIPPPDSSDTP